MNLIQQSPYIKSGIKENFTRPKSGIDALMSSQGRDTIWNTTKDKNTILRLRCFSHNVMGDRVLIETVIVLSFKDSSHTIICENRYDIDICGNIDVSSLMKINSFLREVQRVGVEFVIAKGFDELRYFGYGPNECYVDRKSSA